jgi:hypothetical protein
MKQILIVVSLSLPPVHTFMMGATMGMTTVTGMLS